MTHLMQSNQYYFQVTNTFPIFELNLSNNVFFQMLPSEQVILRVTQAINLPFF